MLRQFESLCYADSESIRAEAMAQLEKLTQEVSALPEDQVEKRKGEVLQVTKALRYLGKFKLVADNLAARQKLEALIKARNWEPKK
jgi:hypothetical protein